MKNMAINNEADEQNLEGVHGRVATPEEVAQRDGYVQGRQDEHYVQRELREYDKVIAQSRAKDNAASGVVFGIAIAIAAAAVGVAAYFLLANERTTDLAPTVAPPTQQDTLIDREPTIEQPSPAPPVSLPDVQIDVPDVNAPDVDTTNEAPAEAEPDTQVQPEATTDSPADTEATPAD